MTKAVPEKLLRVAVDTNVLISALLFGGNPARVIELAKEGKIELFVSPFILNEFEEKLKTKFGFSPQAAHAAGVLIRAIAKTVEPKQTLRIIRRKDSDNRILECAHEAKAHLLVTGDIKDLLPLKSFHNIEILSPSAFLHNYFTIPK